MVSKKEGVMDIVIILLIALLVLGIKNARG